MTDRVRGSIDVVAMDVLRPGQSWGKVLDFDFAEFDALQNYASDPHDHDDADSQSRDGDSIGAKS